MQVLNTKKAYKEKYSFFFVVIGRHSNCYRQTAPRLWHPGSPFENIFPLYALYGLEKKQNPPTSFPLHSEVQVKCPNVKFSIRGTLHPKCNANFLFNELYLVYTSSLARGTVKTSPGGGGGCRPKWWDSFREPFIFACYTARDHFESSPNPLDLSPSLTKWFIACEKYVSIPC